MTADFVPDDSANNSLLAQSAGNFTIESFQLSTTGGTTLRYDGSQFIQNWQTLKNANKCYRVTMTATDGSMLSAFFKTK